MNKHQATIRRVLAEKPEPTVALNPLTGLQWEDIQDIGRRTTVQGLRQPFILSKHLLGHTRKLVDVVANRSNHLPEPRDPRFRDEAWQEDGFYKRLMQSYLAFNESLEAWVNDLKLSEVDRLRADFLLRLVGDSLSPTNTLLGNPVAMRRARETGGASIVKGMKNLLSDWQNNHGLPRQVKADCFELGENIARSRGAVVFRNEVLELIQYQPTTTKVHRRPVLMVSAMINKFYALDLSPEKSMVKYCLGSGQQVFVVSWANPQKENADWGIERYAMAVVEALAAVKSITRCNDVNLFALCSGGMAMAAMAAWLQGEGDRSINSMTLGVCMLEMLNTDMEMSAFASDDLYERVKQRSAKAGILRGHELALSMLWLRPQDLVWNNVVNNYLLGQDPPEFDLLYWNNDWTNLPAALHADVIDMFSTGKLLHAGEMQFAGKSLDLQSVECDKFFVGGLSDHITPWKACYRSATFFSGNCEFVLSNSGHIQTLLNSPAKKRVSYFARSGMPEDAGEWLEGSELVEGSWWDHWRNWLLARSGATKNAPKKLGNKEYPALCKAPGEYVYQGSESLP